MLKWATQVYQCTASVLCTQGLFAKHEWLSFFSQRVVMVNEENFRRLMVAAAIKWVKCIPVLKLTWLYASKDKRISLNKEVNIQDVLHVRIWAKQCRKSFFYKRWEKCMLATWKDMFLVIRDCRKRIGASVQWFANVSTHPQGYQQVSQPNGVCLNVTLANVLGPGNCR